MKLRLKSLSWWLAGAFLIWSLAECLLLKGDSTRFYLAALKYPPMWPMFPVVVGINFDVAEWLAPGDPRDLDPAVGRQLVLAENLILIIVGTLWHWVVGRLISALLGVIAFFFPQRTEAAKAS